MYIREMQKCTERRFKEDSGCGQYARDDLGLNISGTQIHPTVTIYI